jgi:hypothetical protein
MGKGNGGQRVKHQKVGCHGELSHDEDSEYDYYRCLKCDTRWTKRKRKATTKEVNMKVTIYGYNDFFDGQPVDSMTVEGPREEINGQIAAFAMKFKSISLDQA